MQTKLGVPLARVSTPVLKPIDALNKDYDGLQSFESFVEAIYRSAKSFLSEHRCFKKMANNSALLDHLVSGCEILFKSKNDPCYLEGQILERSVWTVLKGSVDLALNVRPEHKKMEELDLSFRMNASPNAANSLARAPFSHKLAAMRHSLATVRTGTAFAPFAVPNSIKKLSKIRADHDAVAAENNTIVAVFFLKHSDDDTTIAMCMMEQEIAFASQWRQSRKSAGDYAIVHSLSITSPKISSVPPQNSSERYQAARPKTSLEGKVDATLFLPKLAGSRSVDILHNDHILDVNEHTLVALSDSALEELYVKLLREREEQARTDQDCSKPCPSPHQLIQHEAGSVQKSHQDSFAVEVNPDVEKKILNIFAVDKFKRKASVIPEINSEVFSAAAAAAALESKYRLNLTSEPKEESTLSSETKSGLSSSPESQTAERSAQNR